MSISEKQYRVTMSDGSVWELPVLQIAANRATYYADKDGVSFSESFDDDTVPLFEGDDFEIIDWATNNMNWSDIELYATRVELPPTPDYEEGWVNGEHQIV